MNYKVLQQNTFTKGSFSIVPIRFEDRMVIMKWRNEQIYHLRQKKLLTIEEQDNYFSNFVSKLFDQLQPNQILFSFLENEVCIGYGGLVHINWTDKNAEISFIMDTALEDNRFQEIWSVFLNLLEEVAFVNLKLHKINTFAFDLRPQLYQVLEKGGFLKEAVLKEHCFFNNKFIDVVIHEKRRKKNELKLRKANANDKELIYNWANDELTRKMSFNSDKITLKEHIEWFDNQLQANDNALLVVEIEENFKYKPIGQVKFDKEGVIGISLDKEYRGKGLGVKVIELGLHYIKNNADFGQIIAFIKKNNKGSITIFEKAGFVNTEELRINNEECFKYTCTIN